MQNRLKDLHQLIKEREKMETIHYKKHLIILDGQGYWNSNTLTNGDITATIYNESDESVFKMKYVYFKKNIRQFVSVNYLLSSP